MAKIKIVRPKKKRGEAKAPAFDIQIFDMQTRISKYDAFRSQSIELVLRPPKSDVGAVKYEFVGPLVGKRTRGTFIQCATPLLKKKKKSPKDKEKVSA
ncbi:hypothetical protein [Pseudomonas fulva]|uniref:hypothetical protein n=1 Tax=Pseudomonas fulva TaxID=47880 RepID=UPI003CFDD56A